MDDVECRCGRGYYDPEQYSSCYDCYLERRQSYLTCVYCGRWHSPDYGTCFQCRQIAGRDEAGKNMRVDTLIRDNFTCYDCKTTDLLQIDHIRPCAHGGTAHPWNLQVLCFFCNQRKGATWSPRWNDVRVRWMHVYLTAGWSLLSEEEREDLCCDVDKQRSMHPCLQTHAHYLERRGGMPEIPNWAMEMANADVARLGGIVIALPQPVKT